MKTIVKALTICSAITFFSLSFMFLETDRRYCVGCASTHLNITIEEAYVLRNQYFAELDFLTNLFLALGIVTLLIGGFIHWYANSKEKKQQ